MAAVGRQNYDTRGTKNQVTIWQFTHSTQLIVLSQNWSFQHPILTLTQMLISFQQNMAEKFYHAAQQKSSDNRKKF